METPRQLMRCSLALAVGAAILSQPAVAGAEDVPVVPSKVLADAPTPIEPGSSDSSAQQNRTNSSNGLNRDSHITVKPGENTLVPVAIDHLNRIVTPFSHPQVTTTSAATTQIRENVVYVGTETEAPVTLFVTQKDSESQAISLTLVPRRIAPREMFVNLDTTTRASLGIGTNRRAEKWETSQPYVETLRDLLRNVALGDTPSGYTLNDPTPDMLPSCQQAGLSFDFANGQMLHGNNFTVAIGVAENTSGSQPIEFNEASCGNWNVGAVAAWPENVIAPDDATEVYVVLRHDEPDIAPERERPSLLTGGR
ncbi:TraK domain-containing protein [Vreelandella massiliensis]|uniref:TraK domain-containing protein n=1 Tax=Vreelandella massiliensis TaxID=1816686 RepID=UPI00096A52CE|nr:type-F conjugative transfer system secretin TraK [Halomonas massiliensis]